MGLVEVGMGDEGVLGIVFGGVVVVVGAGTAAAADGSCAPDAAAPPLAGVFGETIVLPTRTSASASPGTSLSSWAAPGATAYSSFSV
jgi:hypothetical protein